MLFYNSAVFSFKILLHIFLPLDRRLNATLHKKLHAHHDVACVEKCVDDTCCRSVNFLKTLDGKKDEKNCELFHDVVPPAESYSLSRNDNYDYFTLNIPLRVSIHNSFTEIQTEIEIEVKVDVKVEEEVEEEVVVEVEVEIEIEVKMEVEVKVKLEVDVDVLVWWR